jgi:hypothetical protein
MMSDETRVDDKTTVRKGGQSQAAALKEGDRVTASYTERDGNIIAQSISVGDSASSSSRQRTQ